MFDTFTTLLYLISIAACAALTITSFNKAVKSKYLDDFLGEVTLAFLGGLITFFMILQSGLFFS